jgi:hypothetical protein
MNAGLSDLELLAVNNERFTTDGWIAAGQWPEPSSTPGVQPGLVVCPIPVAMPGIETRAVEELYRLAYERALAALRPTRYEMALQVSQN